MEPDQLARMPHDWSRALAVVAHPDDLEYGAAGAVAAWTDAGKEVRYLLVTRGEAGIDSLPPQECAPLRQAEQQAAAAAVGVSTVEYLDHRDGGVAGGAPRLPRRARGPSDGVPARVPGVDGRPDRFPVRRAAGRRVRAVRDVTAGAVQDADQRGE